MDELYILVAGTIAGFGAVGFGLKTQAKALERLSEALDKLRDRRSKRNAPSRNEHSRLEDRVSQIASSTNPDRHRA